MQISSQSPTDTKRVLTITADTAMLAAAKEVVLKQIAKTGTGNVQGFRAGKAPLAMVEKQVSPEILQNEFLDIAINRLYVDAMTQEKLRVVSQPKVEVTKFVPYTELEVSIEVEALGDIKLPDYKHMKLTPKKVSVSAEEVTTVLTNLRNQSAEKKDVTRASKDGDQVTIDFKGTDAASGDDIAGAEGKSYPLVIGSNTFIPGFEPELIGLKANDEKVFTITFPADYGSAELQNRKVTFAITVVSVQEMVAPKLDDAFAAKAGPFTTVDELKADVKKQLLAEKEQEAKRTFENSLITAIADKATLTVPESLVNDQLDRMDDEERQNLLYQGQTWEEHLTAEGITEEAHREGKRPEAEKRVRAGLVLAEIGEQENIRVTDDELKAQLQILRDRYTNDPQMQTEIDKPTNQRDIRNRIATEKTLEKLVKLVSA